MQLDEFRTRYIENCSRLHEARAIVDIYYPEMSDSVRDIYGQSNIFWGYQEGVLRTDIKENKLGYESNLSSVLKAGEEIAGDVRQLQYNITQRSEELNKALCVQSLSMKLDQFISRLERRLGMYFVDDDRQLKQ